MIFPETGSVELNSHLQKNSKALDHAGTLITSATEEAAEFFVNSNPSNEDCRELENLVPGNPFYTAAFVAAKRSLGAETWILGLRRDGEIVSGCTAFLRRGRMNRRLEIMSIPELSNVDVFWEGLVAHCRKGGISIVIADSFCSTNGFIPNLSGETNRSQRWEFVLDLRENDLEKNLHRTHRANIRKARNLGVEIKRTTDEGACEEHLKLILESRKRRVGRGETVPASVNSEEHRLYLRHGVGELFLAVLDGEVISSDLVLKSANAIYAQSAGTSPRGMSCHASHLLIYTIATTFQDESKQVLNLGGAHDLTGGLAQFKSYFRPKVITLQSAEFYLGNAVRKKLTEVVDRWHSYRHAG